MGLVVVREVVEAEDRWYARYLFPADTRLLFVRAVGSGTRFNLPSSLLSALHWKNDHIFEGGNGSVLLGMMQCLNYSPRSWGIVLGILRDPCSNGQ